MKNKLKSAAAAFATFFTVFSFTACTENVSSPGITDADSVMAGVDSSSEHITDITFSHKADEKVSASENTEPAEISQEGSRIFGSQDNTKIDLFTSAIRDGEGKEYEIRAYMYHIDNGDDMYGSEIFPIKDGMIRGGVAAELLYDGKKIFDQELTVGYMGQVAKSFYIPDIEDNFKVMQLEGGDVFTCAYSDDGQLWFRQYYTVNDGKLKIMERYFSEEEKKQAEGFKIRPANAVYNFITPDKFTVNKNCVVYELDTEAAGLSSYSYECGSYAAGEIPMIFDFENNIVRCEKNEYCGLVYFYYDLG